MIKIINTNPQIIENAIKNIGSKYQNLVGKPDYNESIIARNEIYNELNIIINTNIDGKPIFSGNNYWSISHKKNLVFVATSNKPIGIDIEKITKRGNEVYLLHKKNEYEIIGGENLENFYKLWTIKESIIKLFLSGIDDIGKIKIDSIINKGIELDKIKFSYLLNGEFNGKKFTSYCGINKDLVYSISIENLRNSNL